MRGNLLRTKKLKEENLSHEAMNENVENDLKNNVFPDREGPAAEPFDEHIEEPAESGK